MECRLILSGEVTGDPPGSSINITVETCYIQTLKETENDSSWWGFKLANSKWLRKLQKWVWVQFFGWVFESTEFKLLGFYYAIFSFPSISPTLSAWGEVGGGGGGLGGIMRSLVLRVYQGTKREIPWQVLMLKFHISLLLLNLISSSSLLSFSVLNIFSHALFLKIPGAGGQEL